MTKKVTIYLVRHGQTIFNHYNRMQGWSDSPLTEKGVGDADRAGNILKEIKFNHAYSSDTTRAMRTAKRILAANPQAKADSIQLEPYKYFRETFYGYYEGEDSPKAWYMVGAPYSSPTFKDIITKYSLDDSKNFMKTADPFHEAENAEEYWNRITEGFDLIRDESKDGDTVLLVSHGTTIRSIVDHFSTNDEFDVTQSPVNGGITQLTLTDEGINILKYNKKEDIFD